MGGGQGQSKIGQESDRAIADISMGLYKMTKSLRNETIGQITEGLKTGMIQDRTGEIQQLVERAMQGGAVSTQALLDVASTVGQSRTPFIQGKVAGERSIGEQAAALAPSDYINAFIRAGEPILYGQAPALALEGLGSIADTASWQRSQNLVMQGQMTGGLIQGAGQAVGTGVAGVAGGAYGGGGSQTQQPATRPTQGAIYGSRA